MHTQSPQARGPSGSALQSLGHYSIQHGIHIILLRSVSADASVICNRIVLQCTRSHPKRVDLPSQRTPEGAAWTANIAFQLIYPDNKVRSTIIRVKQSTALRSCTPNAFVLVALVEVMLLEVRERHHFSSLMTKCATHF